jgi:hypothetical protein
MPFKKKGEVVRGAGVQEWRSRTQWFVCHRMATRTIHTSHGPSPIGVPPGEEVGRCRKATAGGSR